MKKSLLVLALAAASAAHAADDTITVALAGPETGPVTQYGTIQKIGAEAAIDFINANGGMNGKKIVAKSYDDACEPKQAVTVANKIVADGVKFVIGHLCSASTMPAAEIYNEEGIVMITAASTSPEMSQKGYTTILRTIGTDLQSAPVSAAYIADVIKPKAIALLHDKQAYGQGLVDAVAADLKKRGITPVIIEGVNKGQSDFSALITKLKNANVDFVYWGGFHPEAGAILRQGADQGFKPVFMGADGVDNADLFAIAGDAAEGVLATVPMDFSADPKNAAIVEAIKAKKQDPNGPFVMPAYSAVQVLAEVANRSKSDDPDTVAKELRKGEYETAIGKIAFEENGDLKDFHSVVYELHADGRKILKSQ